jgi:hypothetical protein
MYVECGLKKMVCIFALALPIRRSRMLLCCAQAVLLILLSGCATAPSAKFSRVFDFYADTFAYPNELVWVYEYDAQGNWTTCQREPKPEYAQHCFVVARVARQFLNNARFAPEQPLADQETYRRLIRKVVASNPRKSLPVGQKIVIPGYPNLRQFSEVQEALLKQESGGAWQSYFQRGHWRMIFPFNRQHQETAAEELLAKIEKGETAVLHLVRFPQLTINHAVLLYDAEETEDGIRFDIYDPNRPWAPAYINYNRAERTFYLPPNHYFRGGRVDVYEVFRGGLY